LQQEEDITSILARGRPKTWFIWWTSTLPARPGRGLWKRDAKSWFW